MKYSPLGGEISVEVARSPRDLVTIEVRDQGIGVAPEHREHIFERFYRGRADRGLSGLGLGLYVSRQIVELHGGRIWSEFPADGGSRFVVELPMDAGETADRLPRPG